jgi:hypothetical protein
MNRKRAFVFLVTVLSKIKISIPKKNHFSFYPQPLSFSILSLLFHISFIHPISLPSSLSISPRSFLSISHFATSIPHVLNCLSLLIAHSAHSFLSFRPNLLSLFSFLQLNFAIIFLSLAFPLSRYSGISFVIHLL